MDFLSKEELTGKNIILEINLWYSSEVQQIRGISLSFFRSKSNFQNCLILFFRSKCKYKFIFTKGIFWKLWEISKKGNFFKKGTAWEIFLTMGDFSYYGRFFLPWEIFFQTWEIFTLWEIFPIMGDYFLPWEIISYHGRLFPTMGDFSYQGRS